jgi:glutaminyl-peptide cyclotransferase
MEDDHTPFLERGMRSVDIIDFDYPYWHTTSDTLDKVSSQSLKAVGDVILEWLAGNNP